MKKNNTVKQEIVNRDYIGFIEFPVNYCNFSSSLKQKIVERIIDQLFFEFDKMLKPKVNRILYINDVFESTLIDAVLQEEFEYAALLRDCIILLNKPLNEPNPE